MQFLAISAPYGSMWPDSFCRWIVAYPDTGRSGAWSFRLARAKAHQAGRLLAMTATADVVDAVVVTVALRQKARILASDPDDIERLVRASSAKSQL